MTSSNIVVANIAYQHDGAAEVHLERLFTSAKITGYAEVSSNNITSLSKGPVHADAGIRKAYSKGLKATLRVQQFLNSSSANRNPENAMPATMNVGATSVVGGPPAGCHARDILGIGPASFEEVEFEFFSNEETQSNSSGMTPFCTLQAPRSISSSHHLHFACPTLQSEDAMVDGNGHSRFNSISIISGACLFSNNILKACHPSGGGLYLSPLDYAKPTMYEIDFIARAAPAIADLACTIISRNNTLGLSTPLSINLNIPTWHYYKAVDPKLEQGLCTAQHALLYVQAVEKRHDQISTVFQTAIRHACSVRGQSPIINISSRFNSVSACIKSALAAGFRPGFEDVMQELRQEEGDAWRQFLELVPAKEHPVEFHSLGVLFYVYQVMKTAFLASPSDQGLKYGFEPSLQTSAPEEMSICLPAMSDFTGVLSKNMDDFWSKAAQVEPDLLQGYTSGHIGETADENDNELSFDASSTVDIRVVSPEAWASSADTDSDHSDDMQPECVNVVQDAFYRAADSGFERAFCRSPRLIGHEVVGSSIASTAFLPPALDSFVSAACMTSAQSRGTGAISAGAHDEHSNDAMLPAFEAASSFCNRVSATVSEPSSDDERASHGFMLPSPVLSRAFWAPSWAPASLNGATPILADDATSHATMTAARNHYVTHLFDMDTGITENDGTALDEMVSFAAMISYKPARPTKQSASEDFQRREPLSQDERLSCAAMLPTSTTASNMVMAEAHWNMSDSGEESAAHDAMKQRPGMIEANYAQPAENDEMKSWVVMLPASEAASTAVMVLATPEEPYHSENDTHASHAVMLTTFTEPESSEMARPMCVAASMAPVGAHDSLDYAESSMDLAAAHAAMMATIDERQNYEKPVIEETKQKSKDALVSHFDMLSVDDAASLSGMIGSLGVGDAIDADIWATMPLDDHVSHSAMMCIAEDDESSIHMLRTLSSGEIARSTDMSAADFDVELASHAAMRGIVDLSRSFCMAETLTAALSHQEDSVERRLMEMADANVVILCKAEHEEASNIAMLYAAAEEHASHAAMASAAVDHLNDMDFNERSSHVAMLPESIRPFFMGKPARLPSIVEDTAESLASHAVMLSTSNDGINSHEAMLPTSTDESASHEIMRLASSDGVISHGAMRSNLRGTEMDGMRLEPEDLASHPAGLTSSICMAATLRQERTTATRASSARSSSSSFSADFVKLPENKKASTPPQSEKPRVLIFSLDDRCEKRIYSRAQVLLKKLRASPDADTNPTLVEAYLMSRVFANGNAEGGILNCEDPSPQLPVGEDGLKMGPVDLARKLYGEEAALNFDKWFKDVGLGL